MTRGLWPLRQHSSAAYKPAGPAPTTKTDIPVRGCRGMAEMSTDWIDSVMSLKKLIVGRRVDFRSAKPEILLSQKAFDNRV